MVAARQPADSRSLPPGKMVLTLLRRSQAHGNEDHLVDPIPAEPQTGTAPRMTIRRWFEVSDEFPITIFKALSPLRQHGALRAVMVTFHHLKEWVLSRGSDLRGK